MAVCSKCGKPNADDARFCQACGAPLAPRAPVRKTVTIVFSDLSGSTALAERLDAEALRDVLDRYFDEMRDALERHGGTVEKFIGDAVMAVFGLPVVHEDDAVRAVRAASEMQKVLDLLNEELQGRFGVHLSSRIGVNTGEVVAGDPSGGQRLVTGDAVNVAARLEQAATPGEVLLGDLTHRLVRREVDAEPVEPLSLKGKSQPVAAYRLLRVFAQPTGPSLDASMVGRERELAALHAALERCIGEHGCYLVSVLGAPGVGKSRLVAEFMSGARARAIVVRGRCISYGEGMTFRPLADVVREAAALADDDPPELRPRKLLALAAGHEEADRISRRVFAAVGWADEVFPIEETFWAVRKLFEAVARRRPLVVVIEDLHWAEPTFLDLIEHLVDFVRNAPILLACTARHELLDERPFWATERLQASTVNLEPLAEAEAEKLLTSLLGEALEAGVRSRLLEAAEGNPLFVEQMVSMLVDEGLLRRRDGDWVPAGDLSRIPVPASVSALLDARIDRLPREERSLLERASIVGKVFGLAALAALSPEEERTAMAVNILALERKGFLGRGPQILDGEQAYAFRHALIVDAAYRGMLKKARAELHERFATWLDEWGGERGGDEIVGYHLEQSYRYRAELGPIGDREWEVARKASERLGAAGQTALMRGDSRAAANLLGRAVALPVSEEQARAGFLVGLGAALAATGEYARADESLTEAIEVARATDDRRIEQLAIVERSGLRASTTLSMTVAQLHAELETAIRIFTELEDDHGLAMAWSALAYNYARSPDLAAMLQAAEQGLEHARRVGEVRDLAACAGQVFLALFDGPTPVPEARRRAEQLLESCRGERLEGFALQQLAVQTGMLGRFDEARALSARSKGMAEELGLPTSIASRAHLRSFIERWAQDLRAAEAELRRSHEIYCQLGDRVAIAESAIELADVLYEQGRYDEAYELTESAREPAAPDQFFMHALWRSVRAKLLARRGERDEAETLARQALSLIEATDAVYLQGRVLVNLAEVLCMAGKPGEGAAALEDAVSLYERKGIVPLAAKARSMLAELLAGQLA